MSHLAAWKLPFGGAQAGATAAGATQGTALAITNSNVEVTTTAAATGVRLPVAVAGMRIVVSNRGANSLSVYPATGGNIDGLGSNNPFALASNTQVVYFASTANQWYSIQTSGGSSAGLIGETITFANAFSAGNVITHTLGSYGKAQADSAANAEVFGVLSAATGANFTICYAGKMTLAAHGFTDAAVLFLSAVTPGLLTATEPTTPGQVSKPVAIVYDANTLLIIPQRGMLVPAANTVYVDAGNLASSGTTNIGAAAGDYVTITGVTTITAFDTVAAGLQRTVKFAGILTLTHNGTSLILPGTTNITTAANDTAIFRSLGSGNWICINYKKANGTAVVASSGGKVAQVVMTTYATYSSNSTAIPFDDTIPQITEGEEILSQAITPTSASSTLYFKVNAVLYGTDYPIVALFKDPTANALAAGVNQTVNKIEAIYLAYSESAASTAARTYKVRVGPASGTIYVNGDSGARKFGGVEFCSIEIWEVLP